MKEHRIAYLVSIVLVLAACKAAPKISSVEGTYSAKISVASAPARKVTLTLNKDQTAKMESDLMNGRPVIVETGSWEFTPDGNVAVNLMMQYEGSIREVLVFTKNGDMLNSTQHDQNIYGTEGLKLKKVK